MVSSTAHHGQEVVGEGDGKAEVQEGQTWEPGVHFQPPPGFLNVGKRLQHVKDSHLQCITHLSAELAFTLKHQQQQILSIQGMHQVQKSTGVLLLASPLPVNTSACRQQLDLS